MPKRAFPRSIVLHPSSLPPDLLAPVCPTPSKTWGPAGRKAGVGYALFCSSDSISLLHHSPLVPVRVWGLGKRTDLCRCFHTSPVQSGVDSSPP